jgi:hypothetical protein
LVLISKKRTLSRGKTLELLDRLAANSGGEALRICLPHHLASAEVHSHVKTVPAHPDICQEIAELTGRSRTGSAVFWDAEGKYLVLPPFPIQEKSTDHSITIEHLRSLLSQDYLIAIVLVRLGSYAIGVCRGEKLLNSKVGTGLVHGRHHKGGSSSGRFARHRDKQIEYFLTRVCQHAREQIEPHVKSLDYIAYGGAWTTIELLQKQCHLLGSLNKPELPPLLDIPEPRQRVLVSAVSRVWSSTVFEWTEND